MFFKNIKNFKSNTPYVSKLIENHVISYFSETWLSEIENDLLNNINSNYDILSRSEFYIKPLRGRPYGGIAWSIHKDITIENVEFLNEHFSFELRGLQNLMISNL